jgi:hypothetical protein
VHRLAQILDVDPFAILAAMEIRSPWFAVCCAERKLMTVMMVAIQEFGATATAGDDGIQTGENRLVICICV